MDYRDEDMVPTTRNPESIAAAVSIVPARVMLMEKVRRCIAEAGSQGRTCDEVEEVTGLRHQTASARVNELMTKGVIWDTGVRRKTRSGRNAAVWMVPADTRGELGSYGYGEPEKLVTPIASPETAHAYNESFGIPRPTDEQRKATRETLDEMARETLAALRGEK